MDLTNAAILHLIRGSLDQLKSSLTDSGTCHQLAAIQAGLNELALRNDTVFLNDYYQRGMAIAHTGLARTNDTAATAAFASLTPKLAASLHPDAVDHELTRLNACLRELVRAIGVMRPGDKDYLDSICHWESEIGVRRMAPAKPTAAMQDHFTRDRLEAYLQRKFPHRTNLRVTGFDVLSGGFSKLTALFSVHDDIVGDDTMVIRANHPTRNIRTEASDVLHEFPLLDMAYKAGLPLPQPLWLETNEDVLGTRFLVSRKASGKPIGTGHTAELFETITPQIKARLLDTLLRIHRVPVGANDPIVARTHLSRWLPYRDFGSVAVATTEYWMEDIAQHGAQIGPGLRRVYDWLIANAPAPQTFTPVFLHGDYGLHNILFDKNEISAVLDWEIAKIGDPAEDFVPLFLTLNIDYDEELIAAYVTAGGQHVSRFRYYYYLLMVAFRTYIFAAAATQNLATGNANLHFFNYLHGPAYMMTHRVGEIIALAEAARAQDGNT